MIILQNLEIPKQMTHQCDVTLSNASRNSQFGKAILSLFLLETEENHFSGNSAEEDWSTISHQKCCILMCSPFWIEQCLYLYLLLNVCERLSAWMSCVLPLFTSLASLPFCFLQFAYIILLLIRHVLNRCLNYNFFFEKGGTLYAVSPYRPEIISVLDDS